MFSSYNVQGKDLRDGNFFFFSTWFSSDICSYLLETAFFMAIEFTRTNIVASLGNEMDVFSCVCVRALTVLIGIKTGGKGQLKKYHIISPANKVSLDWIDYNQSKADFRAYIF